MTRSGSREIVLGVSGASGTALAIRFLEVATAASDLDRVHLIVSPHAMRVASHELEGNIRSVEELTRFGKIDASRITLYPEGDIGAVIASGSHPVLGMAVIPCSAGTLASIAHGTSRGLIQRAADLNLKERRPVVLALRETPLSMVHAENILQATRAGAIVMPPVPSFYAGQNWSSFIDHFTMRVFDLFGIDIGQDDLRWKGMGHQP